MKMLVVCAMPEEAQEFLKIVTAKQINTDPLFYEINYLNKSCYMLITGVGTINACFALTKMMEIYGKEISNVLNIGYAGGVKLLVHNLYLVDKCFFLDSDLSFFGKDKFIVLGMSNSSFTLMKNIKGLNNTTLFSSNAFQTSVINDDLPYACDMEGISVAYVCKKYNKPLLMIKYISDLVATSNQFKDYDNSEKNSAKEISDFICKYLLGDLC